MKLSTVILGLAVVLIAISLSLFLSDEPEGNVMDTGSVAEEQASGETGVVRRTAAYESRGDGPPEDKVTPPRARATAKVPPMTRKGPVVMGRVVEKSTSKPVPGAAVELLPSVVVKDPNDVNVTTDLTRLRAPHRPLATMMTDDEGGFRFEGVTPGGYTVLVRAKGYGRRFADAFRVTKERAERRIEVALIPGVCFEGRVVAPDGVPVPGVRVELLDVAIDHAPILRTYQEFTDREGRFVFEDLEPGIFAGTLTAKGFGITGMGILALRRGGRRPSSFTLTPEAEVVGRVFDAATGAGLENVVVYALIDIKNRMYPAYLSTRSGKDGAYVLRGAPSRGELVIGALADGYSMDLGENPRAALNPGIRLVASDRNGERELVNLPMLGGATLEGTVLDKATHRPIEGARVLVVSPRAVGLDGRSKPVLTDAQGRFSVEHVPAGYFVVTATHPDYVAAYRGDPNAHLASFLQSDTKREDDTKRLRPGEIREGVVVEMESAVRLRGHVVGPDGEPVGGAIVNFEAKSVPGGDVTTRLQWHDGVQSDGKGAFELGSVPRVDDLIVTATHPEFDPTAVVHLDLAANPLPDDLILELWHGAVVDGKVYRDDGTVAPGLRVRLRPLDVAAPSVAAPGTSGSDVRLRGTFTEGDGQFRLKGIAAGDYVLEVDGGERMRLTLQTGEKKDVTVRLPRTVLVRGMAVGEDGVVLSGVKVSIAVEHVSRNGLAPVTTESSVETDATGRFELRIEEGLSCRVRALAVTRTRISRGRFSFIEWYLVGKAPKFVSGRQPELRLVFAR